jgi:hypothetical protein
LSIIGQSSKEKKRMAHWAEIDSDNIVTRVLVVADDKEDGQTFLAEDLGLGGTWKKTSYNTIGGVHTLGGTPFRKNYAGVGFKFDAAKDAFIPPKPFASWTLNATTCLWEAPTPMPTDDKMYVWDEETTSWKEVE